MERPSILLCVAPQQQLKNTYRFRNFFRIIFVVGISRKKKHQLSHYEFEGGSNSSSVFSYGGNGQQPQQQGQAQTQQQQAVVVGQLATTNAKGELVLANLDLNSQPVSYQVSPFVLIVK